MDRALHFLRSMVATFGPFQLLRELGAGELGEVFLARTPWRTTQCAALKRVRTQNAVFVERFRRSMRVAKAIDHANLVPLFDSGAIDGTLYTCSQLVSGRDVVAVAKRLAELGVGAPAAVGLRVLVDMLCALARIEGLVEHGGVARNVIIGWDGKSRLSDLGWPREGPVDDLVGLGTAVQCLYVGRHPSEPLGEMRPDLPAWIVAVVNALIQGTGDRSAGDLLHAVTTRALAEGVLIAHSAVAGWMTRLFPGFVETKASMRAVSRTEDEAAW